MRCSISWRNGSKPMGGRDIADRPEEKLRDNKGTNLVSAIGMRHFQLRSDEWVDSCDTCKFGCGRENLDWGLG
jgi:hypothetical protein